MARTGINVKGLNEVVANIKVLSQMIEKTTRVQMLKVGKLVQKRAVSITPKDTGNLRESAFVIVGGGKGKGAFPQVIASNNFNTKTDEGKRVAIEHEGVIGSVTPNTKQSPFAVIGFSAFYALKEHEARNETHKIGGAKFLENALNISQKQIVKLISTGIKQTVGRQSQAAMNRFFKHFTG